MKIKAISTILVFTLLISFLNAQSNIDVNNIDIIRTEYGIPHIFTKTNEEAVYGLAWAQCEDNFNMLQKSLAATKGMAGSVVGPKGAILDLIFQIFEIEQFVEERYNQDITPEMDKLINAYVSALNKYAALNPKQVKKKGLFPITSKHLVGNYTLQYHLMHNSVIELGLSLIHI